MGHPLAFKFKPTVSNLIENNERRLETGRDELNSDAERDDKLVGGDREEEVPDERGLVGQADGHPLKDGVQRQGKHDQETAKANLKMKIIKV